MICALLVQQGSMHQRNSFSIRLDAGGAMARASELPCDRAAPLEEALARRDKA